MTRWLAAAMAGMLVCGTAAADIHQPTKRERDKQARRQSFVTTQPAVQYAHEAAPAVRSAHALGQEDTLYLDAIRHLQAGRYEEARAKLTELERVATSVDLKAEAAAAIGDSYYEQGATAQARESYERAIRAYPGNDQTEYIRERLSEIGPAAPSAQGRRAEPAARTAAKAASKASSRTASSGKLAVQVGSFKASKNASKLVAQLRAKGYEAYTFKPDKLYRVRVGPVATRADAMALAERLQKDGYPTRITG